MKRVTQHASCACVPSNNSRPDPFAGHVGRQQAHNTREKNVMVRRTSTASRREAPRRNRAHSKNTTVRDCWDSLLLSAAVKNKKQNQKSTQYRGETNKRVGARTIFGREEACLACLEGPLFSRSRGTSAGFFTAFSGTPRGFLRPFKSIYVPGIQSREVDQQVDPRQQQQQRQESWLFKGRVGRVG